MCVFLVLMWAGPAQCEGTAQTSPISPPIFFSVKLLHGGLKKSWTGLLRLKTTPFPIKKFFYNLTKLSFTNSLYDITQKAGVTSALSTPIH